MPPGVAKSMFILSGVSKGRLDGDIVLTGGKKEKLFPPVLCCRSIPEEPSPTQHGQVMSPACFLSSSGLHQ